MTVYINGTTGYNGPISSVGSISSSGNLTFTGVGAVIAGDFSNATLLSRTVFQTTTANSSTGIYALPSGTSTAASWQATNAADPTNASKILIATNGSTDVQLVSGRNGTGTYLPLTFYTNGSEQMRLDTSGNLMVGRTSPYYSNQKISAYSSSANDVRLAAFSEVAGATAGVDLLTGDGNSSVKSVNNALIFSTADRNNERARIDSSGNLLVGTTNNYSVGATNFVMSKSGYVLAADNTGSANNRNWAIQTNLSSNGSLDFIYSNTNTGWPNAGYGMSLDRSGNLLVGTTTALVSSAGRGNITINGSSDAIISFGIGGTNSAYIFNSASTLELSAPGSRYIQFTTNGSERARIDSSGNLTMGGGSFVGSYFTMYRSSSANTVAATPSIVLSNQNATSGTFMLGGMFGNAYRDVSSSSVVAGVWMEAQNGGAGAFAKAGNVYIGAQDYAGGWNTPAARLSVLYTGTIQFNAYGSGSLSTNASGVISASDGRFKTKTRGITNALDKVLQLADAATFYRWNEGTPWHTEYEEIGWVAQDVAAIIPEASPEPEVPIETGDYGEPQVSKFKNYHDRAILAYMASAIKELKAEFDAYKLTHP